LVVSWRVDVSGTIEVSRLVAQQMYGQPSRPALPSMVHIGWDQAAGGFEGDSGQYFSTTKAAVDAFSKSLAKSVAPRIRVNCVAPGWIQTEWGASTSSAWNERATGESMLERWGTPSDVANAVVWLCQPESSFINGQTIAVNGGWKPMSLSIRSEMSLW
jgi:3-oxoacyl-[acyl-carrier protein] reductase